MRLGIELRLYNAGRDGVNDTFASGSTVEGTIDRYRLVESKAAQRKQTS